MAGSPAERHEKARGFGGSCRRTACVADSSKARELICWTPVPNDTPVPYGVRHQSGRIGLNHVAKEGTPSMTWPCLVAAGGPLDGGADFVWEHQPGSERAASA